MLNFQKATLILSSSYLSSSNLRPDSVILTLPAKYLICWTVSRRRPPPVRPPKLLIKLITVVFSLSLSTRHIILRDRDYLTLSATDVSKKMSMCFVLYQKQQYPSTAEFIALADIDCQVGDILKKSSSKRTVTIHDLVSKYVQPENCTQRIQQQRHHHIELQTSNTIIQLSSHSSPS